MTIEKTETVARRERFTGVEGDAAVAYTFHLPQAFAQRLLGGERGHSLALPQKVVGEPTVERLLQVGYEKEAALARRGRMEVGAAFHDAVKQLAIVGGDIFHISHILQSALYLERGDAGIYHAL